jgi:hypothetical protein
MKSVPTEFNVASFYAKETLHLIDFWHIVLMIADRRQSRCVSRHTALCEINPLGLQSEPRGTLDSHYKKYANYDWQGLGQ